MSSATCATAPDLHRAIDHGGFAFVHGTAMRGMLVPFGSTSDWTAFADSWNHLEMDAYMADGGRYRRRRHAVFAATPGGIERAAHQPHFQTVDYNPLNGGIARWFAPIDAAIGAGPSLSTILAFCHDLFNAMAHAAPAWHVEVHQFRIEARQGEAGRPTPEGLHRDGVDYVLVLLIDRENIASGMTTVHALGGDELGHFTLTDPFDAAIVDDTRVAHGVTPVEALDPAKPAHRDVLVVTFKKS
jgi:hypothetical protein